ncbi:MAG: hypothetical protein A2Z11_04265 [Candidatus Woykebacteria bacterium RBG_16_43_9]|uniref:Uncharacterized protein n=1 Tax=Candidatus Woykebacteria bacterium RBG_16_43_9 TaxID=1802596 RepID=A0A1G1WG69_9BACT|nr:MAG: hypothetical protein A2Z11_04265 [Candidatus Woykebacteria bacterium RBG_16_43_9]
MEDKEQIQKILQRLDNHDKRIGVLEGKKVITGMQEEKKVRKPIKSKAEDLTPPVKKLFDEGFFKEAKIDLGVVDELKNRLLTKKKPLRASVVNVLRKMVREGFLERATIARGKKSLIAYKNKS